MARKQVVVEVSPSRLEVALVRGRTIVASRCQRLGQGSWEDQWPGGALDQLAAPLAKMVQELGCQGASAVIAYWGSGTAVSVCSCPLAIGTAGTERATMLSLGNLADFPVADSPYAVERLVRDAVSRKAGAGGAGEPGQQHMLGVADTEQRAGAVAAWAAGAGLRVEGLIPVDAAAVAAAARHAMEGTENAAPRAVLWIGDHSSVLAMGKQDRLGFVRIIGVGVESLVDALTRPIRTTSPEAEAVTLNREDARAMLCGVGIPAPDQPIPGRTDMNGACLLPLLQPVIQRLMIETKQSLRFGISEEDRERIRICLEGPGADLPNLGAVVWRQCGFSEDNADPVAGERGGENESNAARGAIGAVVHDRRGMPRLLPRALSEANRTRRLRTALLSGSAAAALFVAADTAATYTSLATERARLEHLRTIQRTEDASGLRDRALGARVALSGVEGRIRVALGEEPAWASFMAALSRSTPVQMRLTDVNMKRGAQGSTGMVRGYVRIDEAPDAAEVIKKYVEGLGSIPLVEGVKMGATQRVRVDGHEAQAFELTIPLVSLPSRGVGAAGEEASAAARTREGTP